MKKWKRILAVVLACGMLNNMGMPVMAEESGAGVTDTGQSTTAQEQQIQSDVQQPEETVQPEKIQEPTENEEKEPESVQEPDAGEEEQNTTVPDDTVTDSEDTEITETPVRDAINWTQQRESLQLSADKIVYQDKEQNQVTVKQADNKIELSRIMADTMESQRLFVSFLFEQEKMPEQLQAGDGFSFALPKEYMTLTDTAEPVGVFVCNQQAYEAEVSEIKDMESIAVYNIKDNVVTVTVTEIPPSGNLFGVIELSFQWNQEQITEEGTVCELEFQDTVKTEIGLPKKAAAPEETKESQTEESKPAEKSQTESAEKPEENSQVDEADKKDASDEKEKGNAAKRFFRSVRDLLTDEKSGNQNYAGGTAGSYIFKTGELPVGFTQVKVSVYNKNGGYKVSDNLKVRFKFDMILDEDFLYTTLENDIMKRADYPVQGNMSDMDYEVTIGEYLNGLMEKKELTALDYSYDLGESFREYSDDQPHALYDASGAHCGDYIILDGVVSFEFDGSCYFYDDIVASISMEAALNQGAVRDEPFDVVFDDQGELMHQSTGNSGGGSGGPEDKNYYIEKEAPVQVSDSEITYTVTAGALGEEILNGLQIVDVLDAGLELKSVTYGDKELEQGKDYTYAVDSRTFTYKFAALNSDSSNKITQAELTITAKLSDARYQEVIRSGEINQSFKNTVELRKEGVTDPLDVSDEVTTNMKFTFLSKVGQEEQLNGTRYSWTITANTQLPYLEYGYLVDTLCWTDHKYDFDRGITVHSKNGDIVYKDIAMVDGGDLQWDNLTAEGLNTFIAGQGIKGPFYYLYNTAEINPFYTDEATTPDEPQFKQMAVLVLPFDASSGWTGRTTQEALRVKYYTDLNLHGLSIDDYLLKVKTDESLNPEIRNKAALLWHNTDGKGPGPRLPESIEWDKTADSNVDPLAKTGVSYNPATQELTWKLDVNRCGASLMNVVIEDELKDDYALNTTDDLRIQMRKYNQTSMTEEKDSPLILKGVADEADLTPGTYVILDRDGKKVIKIALGDLVSWSEGLATHYCCTLDFKLKLTESKYLANQDENQSASNSARITAELMGKLFADEAEGTIKVPNRLIDKTAAGSYDYQTHKLTWQVEINPNKLPIEKAVITDTLPENIVWVGITDIKKNGVSLNSGKWPELIDTPSVNAQDITIQFKNKIEDTYTFTFESSVTDAWKTANQQALAAAGFVQVENLAKLDGTIYGGQITNAQDRATHTIDHVKVGKSGVYDKATETITWTVLMNTDQVNIKGMYLMEDISGANDVHELDVDSVKVDTVEIDQDGNVIEDKVTQVKEPDIRTLDKNAQKGDLPDYRGFVFYLPDNADDYHTYRITFTTELQPGAANASIENKVYLKHADDSIYDESDTSDGGYDGSFDAADFVTKSTRPKITMTKASSNSVDLSAADKELLLKDAEFSLIAYDFTVLNDTITLGKEMVRYDKVRLTDDSGKTLFLNIKAESGDGRQLIYKLEETTPPAGYDAVEDYYIIFSKKSVDQYTSIKTVNNSGQTVSLTDDNYIVKKAASKIADETTAALILQDTPVDTKFTFGKELASAVQYTNDNGISYTYGRRPEKDAVVFEIKPKGEPLNGHVKTRYISNDANGDFTVSGLDPGTYTLTEVKSPVTTTIGAQYILEVTWNEGTGRYEYSIRGENNHNTILESDGTSKQFIKNGYLSGSFSFTKQVKYKDEATDGTNPHNNEEILGGAAFRLKSTEIAGAANTTFMQTAVSDSKGKVSFKDVPVGEYTLEEGIIKAGTFIGTVSGYHKTDIIKVKVEEAEDQNTIIGKDDKKTYYGKKVKVTYTSTDDKEQSLVADNTYTNEAVKGTISFIKMTGAGVTDLTAFDDKSSVLSGAEFGLYRKIGSDIALKPTYTASSGSDGKVEFRNVEYGDYVLKETKTPAGYITMEPVTLLRSNYTVTDDNTGFSYNVTSEAADSGYVKNELNSYSLTLKKLDVDGNGLSEKTFHIYRRNSKAIEVKGGNLEVNADLPVTSYYAYTPQTSVKSGETGEIALTRLPYGDYLLVEDTTGSSLQEGSANPAVHITLNTDSAGETQTEVKMTQDIAAELKGDSYSLSAETVAKWETIHLRGAFYPIVNSLKYAYIQVNKTVANLAGTDLLSTGQKLSGAVFEIYQGGKAEGTPYLTLTTDAGGGFSTNTDGSYRDGVSGSNKHLFYGTYTVKEKSAPAGFKVNTDAVTFEITEKGCGHEGTVWIKTETDGTPAAAFVKEKDTADDTTKGFFGNELNRGRFSLKKTETDRTTVLHDAEYQILDGEKAAAILTEDGDTGIYKLDAVPDEVTNKVTVKKVNGVDCEYLYDVNRSDDVTDYHLLAGTYTVKETKAPAGYETSDFTFTIKEDGSLTVHTISSGYGTVAADDSDTSMAVLAEQPVTLEIDKRAVTVDGQVLNGAEFQVKGNFTNAGITGTVSLKEANDSHLFKPGEEYVLTESKAPYGYLKGQSVTIKFNEKGELVLPEAGDNIKPKGEHKDKLVYADQPFEIYLNKADADEANAALSGAEFSLSGTFADESGVLRSQSDTITVATDGAKKGTPLSAAVQAQGNTYRLAQGQTYTLTETKASDGYILPESPAAVSFTIDEEGKVQFTETEDAAGNGTNKITVKNHRITVKLQKRDGTDNSVLTTAVVTLKDSATGIEKEVAIDKETISYKNSVTEPFLIQGHTYEIRESEAGTPTGYVTPQGTLASFTVNADGSLHLNDTASLVTIATDDMKTSTITIKNERRTGEIVVHKVDGNDASINLEGAVFNLDKQGNDAPLDVNGSTDFATASDGTVKVSALEWGSYSLKEITPPKGYEISEAMRDGIPFEISADSLTPEITSGSVIGNIENHKNIFTLTKADEAEPENQLTGAVFTLKDITENSGLNETLDSGSATHIFEGRLTAGHTYEVEETAAPQGYLRETKKIQFIMQKDGTIKAASDWNGTGYSITADKKGIRLKDAPNVFALKKTAGSDTGNVQKTVEFKMTGTFADGRTEITGVTDKNGIWKIEKALTAGQTYKVTETKALAGYSYAADFDVHVDNDGNIWVGNTKVTEKSPYVVVNMPLNISICKKDDSKDKKPIEGIAFTMTKEGDSTGRIWTLKSDDRGKLNVVDKDNNLSDTLAQILEVDKEGSTYILTEKVQAGSPYIALDAAVKVTIDRNGQIQKAVSADKAADLSSQINISEDKLTLDITNIRTRINIRKQGADGLLPDAKLAIYSDDNGKAGDIVILDGNKLQWTTSADEAYSLRGLPTGTYWLKENGAPDTYVTAEPIKFEITDTGTVNILNEKGSVNGETLTMTDEKVVGQFTVTKTQTETDTEVAGAVFALYRQTGNTPADTDVLLAEGITTGADGTWSSSTSDILRLDDGSKLLKDGLPDGVYYLRETSTPDEYQLDKRAIPFVIKGKVNGDIVVQPDTAEVTADNALYSRELSIEKQDAEDGTVLSDAVFSLTRIADAAGNKVTEASAEATTDSEGKAVFAIAKKGTYRLSEITAPNGYSDASKEHPAYEKVFTIDDDTEAAITLETGIKKNVITNERKTGTLTLMKQDGADAAALDDVTFTLYKKNEGNIFQNIYNFFTGNTYSKVNETEWSDVDGEAGKLTVKGLVWGEYYIEETSPLPGYVPDDTKYEFTIGRYQSEIVLSVDIGVIWNTQTEIRFNKKGLYNESCADTALGAPSPDAVQNMEGITFTAYTDADTAEESKAAEALSDARGEVVFKKLAIGTYYIKETGLSESAAAENYKLKEDIYKAVIDENGQFSGLQTIDGTAVSDNSVVNDVNRTDIIIEKVDEKNTDRKLSNSTYGLFRRASDVKQDKGVTFSAGRGGTVLYTAEDEWVQIAQAVTDENGILRFAGILLDTEYQIRELIAPDGCYVSEKPVTITFGMEDGNVVIKSMDDGKGTAVLDPETGKIVWKEPQVEVEFAKKDESGNLLAGARLEVWDEDNNVIETWTSSAEEIYTSYGRLISGRKYKLVEAESPSGYEIAKPVEFIIPEETVGPNENKVIRIEMTDKKIPVSSGKGITPAKTVGTGDVSHIWRYVLLAVAAMALIAGILYRKKRK